MPWKRRRSFGLTARQAAFVLLASMLTGVLACWIGSGSQDAYSRAASKFSGGAAVPPGLLEKYARHR